MCGRAPLAVVAALIVTLTAACGSSNGPGHAATTARLRTSVTPRTGSPSSPKPATGMPTLTAPAADAASPALTKYGAVKVTAALDLAAHLAYFSVADPALLGKTALHTSIGDYADITRYLTPQGIAYLASYVKDQNRNGKHEIIAGELALASVHLAATGLGKQARSTSGTRFDVPFSPRNYRVTINPTVGLNQDGAAMVVSGRCSVQIPGTRNGKPVLVTLTRRYFTYYVQPRASATYPVGVFGWVSSSTATYAAS